MDELYVLRDLAKAVKKMFAEFEDRPGFEIPVSLAMAICEVKQCLDKVEKERD